MAKIDKYESQNIKDIEFVKKEISEIFKDFADQVGIIGADMTGVPLDKPLDLSKYPLIQKRLDKLVDKLGKRLNVKINNGVKSAWKLANDKNDALVKAVFGDMVKQLSKDQRRAYFNNNQYALNAFLARKEKGLNLSQRVWKYAKLSMGMVESTLEIGIKEGQTAAEIARNLKQYLVYPDKLFRRVRDKQGELHLSKNARAFHPGQGVYRSSYKNAIRLAATENNIAYRSADHCRHRQLDFIVGIHIGLSNNHTLNGKPFHDICDYLAGDYPKWFDFVGWHPLCRCVVTTILKTIEETKRDLDGIDRGSVNTVKDMPPQFNQWLVDNEERILKAQDRGKLPYFLRDNEWAWKEGVEMPTNNGNALTIAMHRHAERTEEQIAEIKERWNTRKRSMQYANNALALCDSIPGFHKELEKEGLDLFYGSLDNWHNTNKYIEPKWLEKAAKGLVDYIKKYRDKLGETLDRPLEAMQTFGYEKAFVTSEAVRSKIYSWVGSNGLEKGDLALLKKKLTYEIKWVEDNKKYDTWELARDAYKKALGQVELREFWEKAGAYDKYLEMLKWAEDNKYPASVAQLKYAFNRKDEDALINAMEFVEVDKKLQNIRDKASAKFQGYRKVFEGLAKSEGANYYEELESAIYARDVDAAVDYYQKGYGLIIMWESANDDADLAMSRAKYMLSHPLPGVNADEIGILYDDLKRAVGNYNMDAMRQLSDKIRDIQIWYDEVEKANQYITPDGYLDALRGLGEEKIIARINDAIKSHNKDELAWAVVDAGNTVSSWNNALDKAGIYLDTENMKPQIIEEINGAIRNYDIKGIADACKKAESYNELLEAVKQVYAIEINFPTKSPKFKEALAKCKQAFADEDRGALYAALADLQLQKTRIEGDRAYSLKKKLNLGEPFDESCFSEERKAKAKLAQSKKEADDLLRPECGQVWKAATEEEKDAAYGWTGSYTPISMPLRGYSYSEYRQRTGNSESYMVEHGLKQIEPLTEIVSKSVYNKDMWVNRFDDYHALWKFGLDIHDHNYKDEDMYGLVGKTGTEGGFWAAGCSKGDGYQQGGCDLVFNIYMPAGTQALYLEPISQCGNGDGRSWDGESKQYSFGSEIEILLQRGTTYRVIKVEKGHSSDVKWYIDVEVIQQNPLPFPYPGDKFPYASPHKSSDYGYAKYFPIVK